MRLAEVDHLPGGAGQGLARARPVAALAGRVRGDDEVLLGRRFEAHVVGHPARQHRQVGRHPPQPPLEVVRVVVGEHAAHLVELADDGLALEPAASGGVPGPEDLHGTLQGLDLLRADRGGLVAVVTRRIGLEGVARALRVPGGVGVEPVVHGVAEN